ncbi:MULTISPECIES: hypothetical protein [Clostridium]|nr:MULTISPECIES: hypothetical protein [Clostridium]MBC2482857.1 hypothetical protein [Clostridium saccharobutylicum]NOW08108.1 hypothetical protein [Clostridium beijerinckii]NYC05784.1 hypothetical protein [Clostridium beijerinckii]CAI9912347.1 Hypothetical protein CAK1_12 [Clostridium phage CAK1]
MVVGCEHEECKTRYDYDSDYGAYYCYIECPICGYYWEGYVNGICDEK